MSSDRMIQLSVIRLGVLRTSAAEFEREVDDVHKRIAEALEEINSDVPPTTVGDYMDS